MPVPVIDAHQHVWDPARAEYSWLGPDLAPINQAMGFDRLLPHLEAAGVQLTVLVQSADNADDTALMRETAEQNPQVVGVVGYAPLGDPAAVADTVGGWRGDSAMVGVRTLIHNDPDPDWLLRSEVDESLSVLADAGLSFDVVAVLPRHLEVAAEVARRHPGLRLVIDHLGHPPIGASERQPWWDLIERVAEAPLVSAKVSGLYATVGGMGEWTTESIAPFFDRAMEVFGAERLMYGGDWPISELAGGYDRVWTGISPLFEVLSPAERERVLGGTAAEVYRLDPARVARGVEAGR